MLLHLQTWAECEAYLKRSTAIIVPIGSTEQHGPNGLIGTDAICAEYISHRVGEQAQAMVGPTISIGMAQHHLAFAGSITMRPTTMIAYVRDYVRSLAMHGFDRFYFVNGHGGNVATLGAAFNELYAEQSLDATGQIRRVRCEQRNWYETPGVKAIGAKEYAGREGSHATPAEVAVTQFVHPEAIKRVGMEPVGPRARRFTDARDLRSLHPDGRIGSDPSLATPEVGKRLVEAAVAELVPDFKAFVAAA